MVSGGYGMAAAGSVFHMTLPLCELQGRKDSNTLDDFNRLPGRNLDYGGIACWFRE